MYVPGVQSSPQGLPWLVSFPRTGSHWLRMVLELYFDRPLLTRHFFEHDNDDYLLWHDHDKDLRAEPTGPVIYLCRGPVATVFSELTYRHAEDAADLPAEEVDRVAHEYLAHLRHWACGGAPEAPALTLSYESLLHEPDRALRPVVELLGGAWDPARAEQARRQVTHAAVAERTSHDGRVIDRGGEKQLRRDLFRYRNGQRLLDLFRAQRDVVHALGPELFELAQPDPARSA